MKKLLGISLLAVFAVAPMIARAADATLFLEPITVTSDVATTSYVKGAYNELGTVINTKQNQLQNTSELSISDTVLTSVRGVENASDTNLVTEKAVAKTGAALSDRIDAIEAGVQGDYATKTGVAETVNTATATGTVQIAQTWGSDDTITHTITSNVAVGGYIPGTSEEDD